MSRGYLRLLPVVLALAGQAQAQEKPLFKFPLELQASLDQMGYSNNEVTGPWGTFKVGADARISGGLRAAIEPFCIPTGRLQLSVGYRFGTEVPTYHSYRTPFNLKDMGQFQVGALYLYPVAGKFELGAGLDMRHDYMLASGGAGTDNKDVTWPGWVRGWARIGPLYPLSTRGRLRVT